MADFSAKKSMATLDAHTGEVLQSLAKFIRGGAISVTLEIT